MKYYGFLTLVLACLMASVFVEGKDLFTSEFFSVAYFTMSTVLVLGSKYPESSRTDITLGLLLMFSVGFLSTELLVKMFTGRASAVAIFQSAIIVSLDYCSLGFLKHGIDMKHIERLKKDDRYGIYGP